MTISFESISASKRTPGIDTEINIRGANQNPPANRQKVMIVGQRMSAIISTPSFQPSADPGLNDCVLGTGPAPAFTGSVYRQFIIEITTAAATDVFRWSNDNGSTWTTAVNASTSNITLSEGVTIKFGAATGHKVGDRWEFVAFPAGAVAERVPTAIYSAGDAALAAGDGSIAHRMIKALLATSDKYGPLDINICTMDDASGTAATGYVEFSGTATSAGYVQLHIGSALFQVSYAVGDTGAQIALALKDEINADTTLPVV